MAVLWNWILSLNWLILLLGLILQALQYWQILDSSDLVSYSSELDLVSLLVAFIWDAKESEFESFDMSKSEPLQFSELYYCGSISSEIWLSDSSDE